MTCWICEEYKECPFEICRTQAELAKEWDNEKALTQEEVKEIQLEFKL